MAFNLEPIMERIFVVVTPVCLHYTGRKVGSKECTQCDYFRGGIIQNFVDCAHDRPRIEQKPAKIEQKTAKRGRPATKAQKKPVKTRKTKKA